jgi:hypothetical protein
MSTEVTPSELDEFIFKARVAGATENAVAKRFGVQPLDVQRVVDRLGPRIDAATRMREFALEVVRLDNLMETYYQLAIEKDHQAAMIAIKLSERRSSLWAFDHAPHRDPAVTVAVPEHRENSTTLIRQAIERVWAEGRTQQPQPQPESAIEAEGVS